MTPTERQVDKLFGEVGELLASHEETQDLSDYEPYRDDPVGFIEEVLGDELTEYQEEIAQAAVEDPLITVRSCHASGKDFLAARLALWWVYARQGLVILTGPSAPQVEEILMRGEIRDAFLGAGLPGELHVRALRPGGEGRAGIVAKTATGVSALTGFHEARVLFVITEAQDPDISHAWDAAFACTTGADDRILTIGNPTEKHGRFYRAHRPGSDWRCFKIAASDVPNVREGEVEVPGLITQDGIDRFRREYGEESAFFTSRVHAEFPEESEDSLFRREWLDRAAELYREETQDPVSGNEEPVAALDPARHGPDASVLAIRRGRMVEEFVVWDDQVDTPDLADRVAAELQARGIRPDTGNQAAVVGPGSQSAYGQVVVDESGLGGGALDMLERAGFKTTGFNGGRSAQDSGRFFDRRAESFWRLRRKLENERLALPDDEELFRELLTTRWRLTPKGQVRIEPKEQLKNRLGHSPDRADALAMAVDHEPASSFAVV